MTREERLQKDGVIGEPLLFYRPQDRWGIFSNFSLHPVTLRHPFLNVPFTYRTSEHRYQAMKAMTRLDHDWVAEAETPSQTKARGGPKGIQLRPDWGSSYGDLCYYVMLEVVLAKAWQHHELRDALMMSKSAHKTIYEDSPVDDIWGWRCRTDHSGKNLLGLALMQVRELLI